MSFCRCPVDVRKKNDFGDEWCSICGAIRHTKQPPAPEPEFPGHSMFECPHTVVIGDHPNGITALVQCARCARLGTRLSGSIRWFDIPGPRTLPGPPTRIWSGEAENVGAAQADVPLVGTATDTNLGSTKP